MWRGRKGRGGEGRGGDWSWEEVHALVTEIAD